MGERRLQAAGCAPGGRLEQALTGAEYRAHSAARYRAQARPPAAVPSAGRPSVLALVAYRAPSALPLVASGRRHAASDEASRNTPDAGFPSGREPRRSERRPNSSSRSPRDRLTPEDSQDIRPEPPAVRLEARRHGTDRQAPARTPPAAPKRQRRFAISFSPKNPSTADDTSA